LQSAADHFCPGIFQFFPRVLVFNHSLQKQNTTAYWDGYADAACFSEFHAMPRAGKERVSVGLTSTWTSTWVGKEELRWQKQWYHMWVILTVHAAPGTKGKNTLIWDCDGHAFDDSAEERGVLTSRQISVIKSMRHIKGRHHEAVWMSTPRAERNRTGICVNLTLEWLIELVVKGLCLQEAKGGLVGVDGFKKIRYRR
jgi:hypothetical protein